MQLLYKQISSSLNLTHQLGSVCRKSNGADSLRAAVSPKLMAQTAGGNVFYKHRSFNPGHIVISFPKLLCITSVCFNPQNCFIFSLCDCKTDFEVSLNNGNTSVQSFLSVYLPVRTAE